MIALYVILAIVVIVMFVIIIKNIVTGIATKSWYIAPKLFFIILSYLFKIHTDISLNILDLLKHNHLRPYVLVFWLSQNNQLNHLIYDEIILLILFLLSLMYQYNHLLNNLLVVLSYCHIANWYQYWFWYFWWS